MYSVSPEYINASKALTKYELLVGTIELTDGSSLAVADNVLVENSTSIDWQCLDKNDTLSYGGAVSAELHLGIFSELSRYAFLDAKITLTYKLLIDDTDEPVFEDVPLGVFWVNDSEKDSGRVSLTAYDALIKLDKPIGSHVFSGTPLAIFEDICEKCGIPLGLSEETIINFPNYSELIQLDQTNGCTSYREIAMAVAQMLGGFVVADRLGRLSMRLFSTVAIDTLTEANRYKYVPADYYCAYTELSITGMKGTFTAKGTIPHPDMPNGLTMYMDDAPAWDYGTEVTLQIRANQIMARLQNLYYTPASVEMPNNPAYDCGDLITMVVNNSTLQFLVTEIQWSYRHPMEMTSVGTNPFFNDVNGMRGSSSRQIGIETSGGALSMYSYTNTEALSYNAPTDWETLIHLSFMSKSDTSVFFIANVTLDADIIGTSHVLEIPIIGDNGATTITASDGSEISVLNVTVDDAKRATITFKYVFDSIDITTDTRDTLTDLPNLESLFLPLPIVSEQAVHTLDVQFRCGIGEVRNITVNQFGIQAALLGQNLVDPTDFWDGVISVVDQIALILFAMPNIPVTETSMTVNTYVPHQVGVTETYDAVDFDTLSLQSVEEDCTISVRYLDSVIRMSNVVPVYMGQWGLI